VSCQRTHRNVPSHGSNPNRSIRKFRSLALAPLTFLSNLCFPSSEVVLPSISHITTASVNSDSNPNPQSSLTMAVAPSIHSTPSEQGHAPSFSNDSAEALIGGNELMGDSVTTQESQLQTRPFKHKQPIARTCSHARSCRIEDNCPQ